MPSNKTRKQDVSGLALELDPELFLGDVAVTLAAELEETIGVIEASTFVGHVGDQLGGALSGRYENAMEGLPKEPRVLAELLVDLKARVGGCFRVEHADDGQIVLTATRCPFSDRVKGHPSLCMMTTNVFGRIVADARGFARVHVAQSIATGHAGCRVLIDLAPEGETSQQAEGYEFYA